MTLTSLKVLPVDDDELPRDTQLNFVGGLPDGAESVRYRVNDTMPNTAVRLFLDHAEPRVQFVKNSQESVELSLDRTVERSVRDLVVEYIGIYAHNSSRFRSYYLYFGSYFDLRSVWLTS